MTQKPNLILVKKSKKLQSSNNFWRCCPLAREYLPEGPCPEGQPSSNKSQEEPKCAWWINSAEHNFCFWKYVKDKSDSDGVMKALVQSELAALFGWSNTKTHFMLKTAMVELEAAFKLHGAEELLEDLNSDQLDNGFNYEDFVGTNSEESQE